MRQNLNLVTDPRFAWRTRRFSGYDIPPQEVVELYKLYTQTGGPSWIDHTNWFANKTCATWYGLTVAGGRVTQISLANNNLAGVTSFSPKPFARLDLITLAFNANLSIALRASDLPSTCRTVYMNNTQISLTGTVAEYALAAPLLQYWYVHYTPSLLTGDITDLSSVMKRTLAQESPSAISAGATPMKALGIEQLKVGTGSTTASKDSIIERLYADRALFTDAAHVLDISGGEGPLTGVYQTSAAPSTPAEKAYALVNDQNAEGFLKWVITL